MTASTRPSDPLPRGLENPGAIDAVTLVGEVAELELWQTAAWDDTDRQLLLVQEKLYNYLSFVADGDLATTEPRAKGWVVVVRCWQRPSGRLAHLLRVAAGQATQARGAVEVRMDGGPFEPGAPSAPA